MDAKKQLRIKSGVVKRLNKEVQMYQKEVVDGELKVQQMKDEGKDPYDIKKMGEVVDESKAMVPDARNRLRKAVEDLDLLLEDKSSADLPEYKTAQEIRDDVVV
eukprot:sb/3478056/